VIRASVAKSRKAREIPLDDGTFEMLAELQDQAKNRQPSTDRRVGDFSRDHVFVTGANTPWRNNLLREFYRVCGRAGIEGAGECGSVDLHSLRVTAASLMIEHGASPKAVQAILGHSTLALTMGVYAKATERSKRDAISALPFAKASAPVHVVSMDPKSTECATSVSGSTEVRTA
jgi:integrase